MKKHLYWSVALLLPLIATGCSNATEVSTAQLDKITTLTRTPTHTPTAARDTSWSLIATLQALPQDIISTSLAYYNYNNIEPTQTPIPVVTPVLPTLTSFPVDYESLPKLNDVIISTLDLEKIKATPEELSNDFLVYLLDTNPLVDVVDAKNELRDCLLDCAKYRYSLEDGLLTTILLRTGNKQKAENTVENLKKEFLELETDNSNWWARDDTDFLPEIAPKGVPSTTWMMVVEKSEHLPPLPESQLLYEGQRPPVLVTQVIATGVAHGNIVVLITYHRKIYIKEGWAADIGTLEAKDYPLHFLRMQINKLDAAGYPK
jgi:hypothetical protein